MANVGWIISYRPIHKSTCSRVQYAQKKNETEPMQVKVWQFKIIE